MSVPRKLLTQLSRLDPRDVLELDGARRRWLTAGLFLLPSLAVLATFRLFSLLYNFYLTFHQSTYSSGMEYVGLENWQRLASDDVFVTATLNTVLFLGTIPIGIAIALGLALLLNKRFPGAKVMRSVFFIPYLTAMVAIAVIWQFILQTEGGILNRALMEIGLIQAEISWLGDSLWARVSVFFVQIWKSVGFYLVILLAGLQNISDQVNEVARIDGASVYQRFRYVTLPLLKPTLGVCVLVGLVTTFRLFDLITVMTGGGPGRSTEILLTWLYKQAFSFGEIGYAAVLTVMFWVVYMVATISVQLLTQGSDY
jgi:ABC-type sugar transport system permease subunit